MKRYRGHLEIYLGAKVWDTDGVNLKCTDLFGAVQELAGVVSRLQKNYGEAFTIKSYLREA